MSVNDLQNVFDLRLTFPAAASRQPAPSIELGLARGFLFFARFVAQKSGFCPCLAMSGRSPALGCLVLCVFSVLLYYVISLRIWSTVSAIMPNIRCAMTLAAPRTRTVRPPNSSFSRALTRSTMVLFR